MSGLTVEAMLVEYQSFKYSETSKEGNKNKMMELVNERPVLKKDSQGNRNLLNPLFKISRDKLWMRDDHLINFTTIGHILTTPVRRELMDHAIFKLSDLKQDKAEVGRVTSL